MGSDLERPEPTRSVQLPKASCSASDIDSDMAAVGRNRRRAYVVNLRTPSLCSAFNCERKKLSIDVMWEYDIWRWSRTAGPSRPVLDDSKSGTKHVRLRLLPGELGGKNADPSSEDRVLPRGRVMLS
eukprot:3949992-Amphidinium_carterae.3